MISIIVAYAHNLVIGKNNELPWYIPEDLKRFKKVTDGHTVIMGRKTYESIIARLGHPLPNRTNIVISSKMQPQEGIIVADSLSRAIDNSRLDDEIFIIGGNRVFDEAMKTRIVDRLYITKIDKNIEGDVFFPHYDENVWQKIEAESFETDDYTYSFLTYDRKEKSYATV